MMKWWGPFTLWLCFMVLTQRAVSLLWVLGIGPPAGVASHPGPAPRLLGLLVTLMCRTKWCWCGTRTMAASRPHPCPASLPSSARLLAKRGRCWFVWWPPTWSSCWCCRRWDRRPFIDGCHPDCGCCGWCPTCALERRGSLPNTYVPLHAFGTSRTFGGVRLWGPPRSFEGTAADPECCARCACLPLHVLPSAGVP